MSLAVFAIAASLAALQEPRYSPPPEPREQHEALRLFMDCESWICDLDFMRTEITFVNYVRDPADAQLHVIATRQTTGGGGYEYTLTFIGLREFAGLADTLRFVSPGTATDDERRRGLARTLALGLVRYASRTPAAARIEVRYSPAQGAATAPQRPHDPWNAWVFSISASTFLQGEQTFRYRSFSGSLNANRDTERWKIRLNLSGNYNRSSFEIDDSTTFVTRRERYSTSALIVRTFGPHWSLGGRASGFQESYRNIELRSRLAGAIEYSVFPYNQSTRRLLLVRYNLGPEFSDYADTTIFGRVAETRLTHGVEASYTVTQPWGNVTAQSYFSQYLHDTRKLNLSTYVDMSIRLVRGLSLQIWGQYIVVRDQLYLPAAGATPEEIIARQRQLATSYEYFGSIGLSYRFGSVFNNIVNPAFR